jgi:WD40 repeat protein
LTNIGISESDSVKSIKDLGDRYIAVVFNNAVQIINLNDNTLARSLKDCNNIDRLISLSKNRLLALCIRDNTCPRARYYVDFYLWNYRTGELLINMNKLKYGSPIAKLSNGDIAFENYDDSSIRIWDSSIYSNYADFKVECRYLFSLSNDNLVCMHNTSSIIQILDTKIFNVMKQIIIKDFNQGEFLFDNDLLTVAFANGTIQIYDMLRGGGGVKRSIKTNNGKIKRLYKLLKNKIFIEYDDNKYSIWDTKSNRNGQLIDYPPFKCGDTKIFFINYIYYTICGDQRLSQVKSSELVKLSSKTKIHSAECSMSAALAIF